jgi:hypothetical protein
MKDEEENGRQQVNGEEGPPLVKYSIPKGLEG